MLGTQVRQFVDEQVSLVGYGQKESWLQSPTLQFYLHRSFSILVFVVNAGLWWYNRKKGWGLQKINLIMLLILLEVFTGIAMYYFDFPVLSQPLHLVIATFLFGLQYYVVLEVFQRRNTVKTS